MAMPLVPRNAQQVSQDVRVANDLRERRRRQRQRRRARARQAKQIRNVRGNIENSRFVNGNPMSRPEESKYEDIKMNEVMDEDLVRYCEAVVSPFGNECIGALLPDRFQELVVPLTDRLELDITPDLFNYPGSGASWESSSDTQLVGIFIWFQPRCLASGTIVTGTNSAGLVYNVMPFLPVDSEFTTSANAAPVLNAYNLCLTGIWNSSNVNTSPVTYGLFNGFPSSLNYIIPNYVSIQYTRFENVRSNCDKLRILGAGIKAWSEQAPINTGGYSVGGWITIEDICEALECDASGPVSPNQIINLIPRIRFSCRTPGVKGSTVRYSPLQTTEQVEPEYPRPARRLYNLSNPAQVTWSPFVVDVADNADLAVDDLITPGSFVPCIYWSFNTTDDVSSSNNGVYTLKLMSMVHAEGVPTGQCPFISNKSHFDPMSDNVKALVENLDEFPAAVSGHSFRTFLNRVKKLTAKVPSYISRTAKFMSLLDNFVTNK